MYKVHFPVINIDWQKSPVPATDLAEIVFLKFQFLPIESIRLSGPPGPWATKISWGGFQRGFQSQASLIQQNNIQLRFSYYVCRSFWEL